MNYLTTLLKQNQSLFHTSDLALLWNISNKNTLYTTIKRYVKKKALHRIHKGYYSTKPIAEIDPILLGIGYIHDYAYLTTESILSSSGVINQYSTTITLVSNKSINFSLLDTNYIVRKMKPELLYNDYGIELSEKGYKIATPERALVDMIYYNSNFHVDNKDRVNLEEVIKIKKILNIK
ncbi:type IV toxin-antitoxin system AbiEi family antitoxin domain-containing protein [Candidatus Dojkabacteria bacterium]|nr:type IV toxin-antitoxin system AbiEi family antitoxin domain-containing protein [Candidatus Dojkabacteria bacterium]